MALFLLMCFMHWLGMSRLGHAVGLPILSKNPPMSFLSAPTKARTLVLLIAVAILPACSFRESVRPEYVPLPPARAQHIESHQFNLQKDDEVVGSLATVRLREGDSLSDVARHFGLGFEQVSSANPDLEPWAPPADADVLLPLQFVLPEGPRKGIVVNLAAMRLFYFPSGKSGTSQVVTYPVGIGKEGRSTPTGLMTVDRKTAHPTWYVPNSIRRDHALKGDPLPAVVSPGPDNPLGDYAMYLSKPSYLIHGTNKPYSIGFRASNGCLRLYPEDIEDLFEAVPQKTTVKIVNQPYLVGRHDGMLYVEAHTPHDEMDDKRLRNAFKARLKQIEKKQGFSIDWPKVDEVLSQGRGVPIPVLTGSSALTDVLASAVPLERPRKLYEQPLPPALSPDSWYIRAAKTTDQSSARRLAAMLNHQGPRIPAQTVEKNGHYVVLAGPYPDAKTTRMAAKRMKIDLEIKGEIVEPAQRVSMQSGSKVKVQ